MAFPTGDEATSAVGVEKGLPREVRAGIPFDYQLVVTNLASVPLEEVTVTEELEPGLTINRAEPAASVSDGVATWVLRGLQPCESRTININATAAREGMVGTCTEATYRFMLCCGVPVVQPGLAITKAGPAEVLRCDPIEYQFVVTNTGSGELNNVRVTDPLPAGLATADGQRAINFTIDSLDGGESRQFNATVMAERTGRFVNTATAAAEGLTATSNEVATVVRAPMLQVEKTGRTSQFLGRETTYTITVTNTGDGVARDTVLVDPVPAGARFISATAGGQYAGGAVRWNLGNLQPDDSRQVTVTMTRESVGTIRNEATANAYCAAAAADVAQTVYEGIPGLLLEGNDDPDPIELGSTVTYTLIVTNQGTADLTNVQLTPHMEEGTMEFVSARGATPAGAVTGQARGLDIVFPAIDRLAPQAHATYQIVIRATGAGQVSFRAEAQSNEITRPLVKVETTNFYE
ncbi:MAG: DUF11 domain-containing protein [Sedimentisphaerales bacterium]|nr:DUF11 domain-containing protein [Sedimentisphaerales bacterium]